LITSVGSAEPGAFFVILFFRGPMAFNCHAYAAPGTVEPLKERVSFLGHSASWSLIAGAGQSRLEQAESALGQPLERAVWAVENENDSKAASSTMGGPDDITAILQRIGHDRSARDALFRLVEAELRKIAEAYMRSERADHTLQVTALLDDAFLKLIGDGTNLNWESRTHFYRAAAKAMRHILIDHERSKRAAKRPPRNRKLSPDVLVDIVTDPADIDLLALNEAIEKLTRLDPRQGDVVELHHFGGYTLEQVAPMLEISTAAAKGEWTAAKAWLHRELDREDHT
jgi:RNA polymerase sigma factor (TIGR02999 family)